MELLGLEPALIARLAALLPAGTHIRPLRDVGDLERARLPTPAVLIAYAGGSVAEARADGRAARVTQRWTLAAVVRNVANDSDSRAAESAGPLADAMLAATMGWQPEGASAPLRLAGLPAPLYTAGYLAVPVDLETELVLRAEP